MCLVVVVIVVVVLIGVVFFISFYRAHILTLGVMLISIYNPFQNPPHRDTFQVGVSTQVHDG